jgi:hypothetical protein
MRKQQPSTGKENQTLPINSCRYLENYQFKSCVLKKCKLWSEVVPSKCIAVHRTEVLGDKVFSDQELHYYKLASLGLKSRMVSIKRKTAVDRVKCIYILERFLEWITATYEPDKNFRSKKIQDFVGRKKPLTSRALTKPFESWMWKHVPEYRVWLKSQAGECSEFTLEQVLWLSRPVWKKREKTLAI